MPLEFPRDRVLALDRVEVVVRVAAVVGAPGVFVQEHRRVIDPELQVIRHAPRQRHRHRQIVPVAVCLVVDDVRVRRIRAAEDCRRLVVPGHRIVEHVRIGDDPVVEPVVADEVDIESGSSAELFREPDGALPSRAVPVVRRERGPGLRRQRHGAVRRHVTGEHLLARDAAARIGHEIGPALVVEPLPGGHAVVEAHVVGVVVRRLREEQARPATHHQIAVAADIVRQPEPRPEVAVIVIGRDRPVVAVLIPVVDDNLLRRDNPGRGDAVIEIPTDSIGDRQLRRRSPRIPEPGAPQRLVQRHLEVEREILLEAEGVRQQRLIIPRLRVVPLRLRE